MSDNEVLLEVTGVSKKYSKSIASALRYGLRDTFREMANKRHGEILRKGEFWALQDISFKLRRGDCLGIMGRNGAGKSTLLKVIAGLLKPDTGEVQVNGHMEQIIELNAGFKHQLTGRENVKIRAKLLGMSDQEYKSILEEIEDFTELGEFMDSPVEFYSSGMKARLGFSVSTMSRPDILLVDEVLAVGDLPFRLKCYDRLGKMIRNAAVIIVAHSPGKIAKFSNIGCYLHKGVVKRYGDLQEALQCYLEDYVPGKSKTACFNPDVLPVQWYAGTKRIIDQTQVQFGEELYAILDTRQLPPKSAICISMRVPDGHLVCQWDSRRLKEPIPQGIFRFNCGKVDFCPGHYSINVEAMDFDEGTLLSYTEWTQFQVDGDFYKGAPIQRIGSWGKPLQGNDFSIQNIEKTGLDNPYSNLA